MTPSSVRENTASGQSTCMGSISAGFIPFSEEFSLTNLAVVDKNLVVVTPSKERRNLRQLT
jgi:hypothetical protein